MRYPRLVPPAGFHPMYPLKQVPIKASVTIPANTGSEPSELTLHSNKPGEIVLEHGSLRMSVDLDVLNDALIRVQQPDFQVIGQGPLYGQAPMRRGQVLAREPEHVEFEGDFKAGETRTLQKQVEFIFRGERFDVHPETRIDAFEVEALLIGADDQLFGPPVPLKGLAAEHLNLQLADVVPGQLITLRIKNTSDKTQQLRMKLHGISLK